MDLSDYVIDVGITVFVLATVAGLVAIFFASGGSLEAFASQWNMALGAIFAAITIGAIVVIKRLKGRK